MPPPSKNRRLSHAQRRIVQLSIALLTAAVGLWALGILSPFQASVLLVVVIAGGAFAALASGDAERSAAVDVLDSPHEPLAPRGEGPSEKASLREAALAEQRVRIRSRWIGAGVALALLMQMLIPLRYYLGDDAYDERFSWRMFSAVRIQRCDIRASETKNGRTEPVQLMATVQAGWVTMLRRNREAVMERYLEWRCEQEGVERARLENECRTPEGQRVPMIVREIDCASGQIVREGGRE